VSGVSTGEARGHFARRGGAQGARGRTGRARARWIARRTRMHPHAESRGVRVSGALPGVKCVFRGIRAGSPLGLLWQLTARARGPLCSRARRAGAVRVRACVWCGGVRVAPRRAAHRRCVSQRCVCVCVCVCACVCVCVCVCVYGKGAHTRSIRNLREGILWTQHFCCCIFVAATWSRTNGGFGGLEQLLRLPMRIRIVWCWWLLV
jgi:hypothetical protein